MSEQVAAGQGPVQVSRSGRLARVDVGSGDRPNALGTDDWWALAAAVHELALDDELGAVVIAGAGGSSFSAGSRVSEWIGAEPDDVDRSFVAMEAALRAVEDLPVPTVAQVRGAALGAGCQLACACDLRIVGRHARLGMPVARWGVLVPVTFAHRLAVLTGPGVARDLLLTGRIVGGEEAARLGLATQCVPEPDLERSTRDVVQAILVHPQSAVRSAKHAVDLLLAAERDRLRALPIGPTADYNELQNRLRGQ